MNNSPLVTIICLCYNHEQFVMEAIQSVLDQTYEPIQLIVIDDASTDNSLEVVANICESYPEIQFIDNSSNLGNCKSFNKALEYAKGKYLIDLAADDVLLPERVEEGVKAFRKNPDNYGVNFSNAEYIDEGGRHLRYFYPMETGKKVIQGDLFAQLVMSYIISSPTTMFKKEVIDKMGGYDESLAYEDFDFWVRSSREWHYCYTDKVLVKKRVVVNSLGSQQYKRKSVQRMSTYTVCKKAYDLCRSPAEFNALRKRIQYELKYSIWHFNLWLSCRYVLLWLKSIR